MTNYKLSLATKTLTITKAFEEEVAKGAGAEYELYTRLMREIPDLKVVRRTHKTPSKYTTKSGEKFSCNQFKNLTYKTMGNFINFLPEKDKYEKEFNFLKDVASSLQTNGYKLVRSWFIAQFPQFRTDPLSYTKKAPELVKATDIIAEITEEKAVA